MTRRFASPALVALAALTLLAAPAAGVAGSETPTAPAAGGTVRAQLDTVGFAVSWHDMLAVTAAALAAEGLPPLTAAGTVAHPDTATTWAAAIMPHDDYVYAGRTAVHLLPGLRARHWVVFGVCHACRRIGWRDRLILDDFDRWRVAGREFPVNTALRAELLAGLGPASAVVDRERQVREHSVEALLPWLYLAVPDADFVPILVPGMALARMDSLANRLAELLADVCRRRGWEPGRDLGLLISADAVHYGCEQWGGRGYDPFGCDACGHAAAVVQDCTLARATLCGPLTPAGPASFARLVWDDAHPDYPYRITWCGLHSIPFGLLTAAHLQRALALPPLAGRLLRYGDSVTDGRLPAPGTRLGVTAPNTLRHWVGYAAVGYRPAG